MRVVRSGRARHIVGALASSPKRARRSGEAGHVARLSTVRWGRWGSGQQVEGVLRAVLDFGEGHAAAGALVRAGPAQDGDGVGRVGNPEDAVGLDLAVVQ